MPVMKDGPFFGVAAWWPSLAAIPRPKPVSGLRAARILGVNVLAVHGWPATSEETRGLMLEALDRRARRCERWGLPTAAEMYRRAAARRRAA